MTSSIVFLNGNPLFFLDSDNPFNCLNASIKILLPYIRQFWRKKNIVGAPKFAEQLNEVMSIHVRK
jgi:hypothetical protein